MNALTANRDNRDVREPKDRAMNDEPQQDALFDIEGLDEDGCVWICSPAGRDWCQNLGPRDKVAEVLSEWLAAIDYRQKT